MAFEKECEHIGIEIKVVERFEKRIEKLLKDMDKHGLSLFCGSCGSIRYCADTLNNTPLIVGDIHGTNHDGGDGSYRIAEDGLMRGE